MQQLPDFWSLAKGKPPGCQLVTFWASAGITVDFQFLSLLIPQIIATAKMIAKMRGTPTAAKSNAI